MGMDSEDTAVRARRRQDAERMKARARRVMGLWSRGATDAPAHSPRAVGRNASTHCRPCSCWLCRGHKNEPRKHERVCEDWRESLS